MTALKAMKALKNDTHFKASKRRNQPFLTVSGIAMKAMKSKTISQHQKNPMKSSFEALKALNPPTGGKCAFHSAHFPCRGAAQTN